MDTTNSTIPADLDYPGAEFDFRLYRYVPSLPAAIVSVIVFAILTALHTWKVWKHKSLYFIPFTIGGLFQTIGYCGRIWSHYDNEAIGGFVVQAILILVAPALYAASIYMILGRLITALAAPHLSIVPVRWVTRVFVIADVLSFTLQAGGGGIQAGGTLELYDIGEKIIIVGLFVQIVCFSFFVVNSAHFHRAIVKSPTSRSIGGGQDGAPAVAWKRHLYVLYGVSAIILVRSIFRVIEYLQGNGGYLISHEIFLYIFDTILMVAVMVAFLVWYIDDLAGNGVDKGDGILPLGSMTGASRSGTD